MLRATTNRWKHSMAVVVAAVMAFGLLAVPRTAPAEEGYDLMRVITTQWVKPFIVITFDKSGSMRWTADEPDSTWNFKYSSSIQGYVYSQADWTHGNYGRGQGFWMRVKRWKNGKTLWYFVPPSRIAIAKNVFGNEVVLHEPAIPPTGYDQLGKPYYIFNGPGPVNGAWKRWRGSSDNGSGGVWRNWNSSMGHEPVGDPSYTTTVPPSDMIGKFGNVADLGLVYYPRKYWCDNGEPAAVAINPDDNDQAGVLAQLYRYFRLVGNGGLAPGGATPTRAALRGAKNVLETAFQADSKQACGRTYGVILLTDGESNSCNAGRSYCWQDPWTGRCDGRSGYTCPDSWRQFPAGVADELWKLTVGGTKLKVRTWAVGLSQGVGPCELNYTAYKGRTDASSPNGDAGFDLTKDPYLTTGDSNVFDSEVLDPTDGNPGHGPYAYFANGVAQLRNALIDILASLGVGDYTTAAPSVAGSALTAGNTVFLPSSEYPSWRGHLRALKVVGVDPVTGEVLTSQLWDAGEVLANGNNGFTRKIYTWDPARSNRLVEVTVANANRLDAICGGCGIDADVVRFIRGNNRTWQLGALINTTPAVIGQPETWRQGTAGKHAAFESAYANRHTQVWVGSSDGMVHAFDLADGAEVLAILPPDLLDKQVDLKDRYWSNPDKFPLGEPRHPADHVYGVANSVRFADVWDNTARSFRTVLFLTEGPGGTGVHAVDVTHPYPGRTVGGETYDPDPNYDSQAPFEVLWSRTRDGKAGTDVLPQLGQTFSVPAVGIYRTLSNGRAESALLVNEGWWPNPPTGSSSLERPYTVVLDPVDGSVIASHQVTNRSSYLVGNQTFADGVIWQTDATRYRPDNVVDQGVVADLHGTVWSVTGNTFGTRSALFSLGGDQPIYYSPAVGSYPATNPTYDLYAFASGSFYEKSPNVAQGSPGFVATIYLATKSLSDGSTDSVGVPITEVPFPAGKTNPGDSDGDGTTFGPRAQVIASPLLLTPSATSTQNPIAFYLVYDPDAGTCVGKSYMVSVTFDPMNLSSVGSNPQAHFGSFEAGEGAAGGFAVVGEKVVISQSGVGEGSEAHLVTVPDLTIQGGNPAGSILWWVEHN